MRAHRGLAWVLLAAWAAGPVVANDAPTDKKPFSEKQLAQQQRMRDCNAEARRQHLKGDAHRAFLRSCLSAGKVTVEIGGAPPPETPIVPADAPQ